MRWSACGSARRTVAAQEVGKSSGLQRRGLHICLLLAAPVMISAQSLGDVPRTPWGDPDLQGIWDNRTITPVERPREFADKATLTAEEAAAYEALTAERRVCIASAPSPTIVSARCTPSRDLGPEPADPCV